MKDIIKKFALKNAVDYDGTPEVNAVLGKVLGRHPEFKEEYSIDEIRDKIGEVIDDISDLSNDEQLDELEKVAPELLEDDEEDEDEGLELPGGEVDDVVMRFAPSPSGPLHLGHAYVLGLNSELVKEYDGELILRIEDTNPDNIYDKAYDLIPEDADWLTKGRVDDVFVQSDRLEKYYDYAERLVSDGNAYVCECSGDEFRSFSRDKEECPCRSKSVEENMDDFEKMFDEFSPGDAVLRLKTDMQHKNPAIRDFALMRINESSHPRTEEEYRVWPLMNFSVAIDDYLMDVTHKLRGKDQMDNDKRQRFIFEYFDWEVPTPIYVGRINFKDLDLSSTKTKELINKGEYDGWDDIRLPFLPALRRRGYQPDAFIEYAKDVGITDTDKTTDKEEFFDAINDYNKDFIDSKASRFFFVEDPVKVSIEDSPSREVSIELHPDFKARGDREFETGNDFLISNDDFENLEEGRVHRLMHCLNFVKEDDGFVFHSVDHEKYKNADDRGRIIHWLPDSEDNLECKLVMGDKSVKEGLVESYVSNLKEETIVQFERVGFAKLDDKESNTFWYLHR